MGKVLFTSNLQRHLSCPTVTARGATVGEVLSSVFEDNPRLRRYLLDDQGSLRRHVNIFINTTIISDRRRLTDPVSPDDDVHVFQALSGG